MEQISCLTENSNTADRSADQTDTPTPNRLAYATGLAQAAFRASYIPPNQANWRDRTPAEIAVIRAMHWSGAAR